MTEVNLRAVGSYLVVLLTTVVGIIGTGLIFTALTSGPVSLIFVGLPLLLIGLYWSGQALGHSLYLAQARQRQLSDQLRLSDGNSRPPTEQ